MDVLKWIESLTASGFLFNLDLNNDFELSNAENLPEADAEFLAANRDFICCALQYAFVAKYSDKTPYFYFGL